MKNMLALMLVSLLCSFEVDHNNSSCVSQKSPHVMRWSMATTSVAAASRESTCEPRTVSRAPAQLNPSPTMKINIRKIVAYMST